MKLVVFSFKFHKKNCSQGTATTWKHLGNSTSAVKHPNNFQMDLKWLGAISQQAITWANVDPDLCHNMASLGHNELISELKVSFNHKFTNIF